VGTSVNLLKIPYDPLELPHARASSRVDITIARSHGAIRNAPRAMSHASPAPSRTHPTLNRHRRTMPTDLPQCPLVNFARRAFPPNDPRHSSFHLQ
jgi:hypothetical protein